MTFSSHVMTLIYIVGLLTSRSFSTAYTFFQFFLICILNPSRYAFLLSQICGWFHFYSCIKLMNIAHNCSRLQSIFTGILLASVFVVHYGDAYDLLAVLSSRGQQTLHIRKACFSSLSMYQSSILLFRPKCASSPRFSIPMSTSRFFLPQAVLALTLAKYFTTLQLMYFIVSNSFHNQIIIVAFLWLEG